jgi:hypothetical protein
MQMRRVLEPLRSTLEQPLIVFFCYRYERCTMLVAANARCKIELSQVVPASSAAIEHRIRCAARAPGREHVDPGDWQDVLGRKGFACQFPQRYRVDKFCCCAYTLAVVLMPSGMVVKGKSSGPGTKKDGSGQVKSGRNGAPAPQSRASLSAVIEDAVHSSG